MHRACAREGRRVLRSAVVGLLALAIPAVARAAGDDRFSLDAGAGWQFERFQSHQADSLGLSTTQGLVGMVEFDLRVLDIPAGKQRPSLHVFGQGFSLDRVIVEPPALPGLGPMTREAPMYELVAGAGFEVPLGMVDGTEGAAFLLYYEGAVYVLRGSGENFLQRSTLLTGFELTAGRFAGSQLVVGNGHDDRFGPDASSGRWTVRSRLAAGIGRERPAAAGAPKTMGRRPLRAFLDMTLETDGKSGPDSVTLRTGLMLDAGAILKRTMTTLGI